MSLRECLADDGHLPTRLDIERRHFPCSDKAERPAVTSTLVFFQPRKSIYCLGGRLVAKTRQGWPGSKQKRSRFGEHQSLTAGVTCMLICNNETVRSNRSVAAILALWKGAICSVLIKLGHTHRLDTIVMIILIVI